MQNEIVLPLEIQALPIHFQKMYLKADELLTRQAVSKLSGNLCSTGFLANADSAGTGIENRCIIFKKTCYPRKEAVLWLARHSKAV